MSDETDDWRVAVAARNVPPSEMTEDREDFRSVWLADQGCRPATRWEWETRKCRRPRCYRHPVMALERSNGWWLYCADHLYGRRIRDGVVEARKWIPAGTHPEV